jgi:hypothetical protein
MGFENTTLVESILQRSHYTDWNTVDDKEPVPEMKISVTGQVFTKHRL